LIHENGAGQTSEGLPGRARCARARRRWSPPRARGPPGCGCVPRV